MNNTPKKKRTFSKEHKRKLSEAHKGRVISEETKRKMSKAQKGRTFSEETKRKLSEANKGKKLSEETKRKMSETRKDRTFSEEHKRKISEALMGHFVSEESKRKTSEGNKKLWTDPKYRENRRQVNSVRPTKTEKTLNKILCKLLPKEYQYVGDGEVIIGRRNPDFMNVNGQKKIIEMFGNYWHSRKFTGMSKKEHRQERQKHFAKYGYKTLVVWEHELQNTKQLKAKIKAFHNE